MSFYNEDIYIIAYRLENEQGISRDFVNDHAVIVPEGYFLGKKDPCVFREGCYAYSIVRHNLIQYILFPTALIYDTGDVLFRKDDIISKTKLGV